MHYLKFLRNLNSNFKVFFKQFRTNKLFSISNNLIKSSQLNNWYTIGSILTILLIKILTKGSDSRVHKLIIL
jgi:hypothetical protein